MKVVSSKVLISALALIALALSIQNWNMKAKLREVRATAQAAKQSMDLVGKPLPAMTAFRSDLSLISLPDDLTGATLLFLSGLGCRHCNDAEREWEFAAEEAERANIDVYGIVVDATLDSIASVESTYPLLAPGDDLSALTHRIRGIPSAVLIGNDGSVWRVFYGPEQVGLLEAIWRISDAD